jgi:hypothetical protein
MIARYVDTGRTEQLPEATAELLEYLLIPYLRVGGDEAHLPCRLSAFARSKDAD